MYYYVLKWYETDIFFIMVFSDVDESSIITTNVIYAPIDVWAAAANKLFIGNGQCAMVL